MQCGGEEEICLDEKNKGRSLALLSYLSVLLFVPLLKKEKNDFVSYHVNQGLVLFVVEFCVGIVLGAVSLVLKYAFPVAYAAISIVFGICLLFFLLCHVVGIVHVLQGQEKKIPVFGEILLYRPAGMDAEPDQQEK